jgi:ABC-type transporter Mla MlaB component
MIHNTNNKFELPKTLTYENAMNAIKAGRQAIDLENQTEISFNLSHLETVDSSAIAVLVDWKKYCAKNNNKTIVFTGVSEQLKNLAMVYGVDELLF